MAFYFGIIVGILIAILVLVIEVYLRANNKGMAQVKRYMEEKTRPKGAIIMPVSENVRSTEAKIKQFESRGEDTPLDEIL